ncbi:MAG TPA: hypothetical protein VHB01_03465 [Nitrosospira sp.]|nr:hypothetical protein [Nitrosospira sp.]
MITPDFNLTAKHLSRGTDALAGPGIVSDHEDEDNDCDCWLTEPPDDCRDEIEDDAHGGAHHLHGENRWWQVQLYQIRMAIQVLERRKPCR